MKSITNLEPWIVKKGTQEFCKFGGYLQEARAMGLCGVQTEWVNQATFDRENPFIVFKATILMRNTTGFGNGDGINTFTGYGDATKNNVGSLIVPHMLRMAETRAIVRALRWATGVALTGLDELGGDDVISK